MDEKSATQPKNHLGSDIPSGDLEHEHEKPVHHPRGKSIDAGRPGGQAGTYTVFHSWSQY